MSAPPPYRGSYSSTTSMLRKSVPSLSDVKGVSAFDMEGLSDHDLKGLTSLNVRFVNSSAGSHDDTAPPLGRTARIKAHYRRFWYWHLLAFVVLFVANVLFMYECRIPCGRGRRLTLTQRLCHLPQTRAGRHQLGPDAGGVHVDEQSDQHLV